MLNYQEIDESYPWKAELHAHTSPCSACSRIPAADLVADYLKYGCSALTITNHLNPTWVDDNPKERAKEYLADYEIAKEAAEGTSMNVLLGVEIRFTENVNDYLIYGVDPDDIEFFISLIPYGIENFYKEAKTDRNLILQAHPFRKDMILAPLDSLDGIEVMNMHPGQNSAVSIAARYASEHHLIISSGSDTHTTNREAVCLLRTRHQLKDSFELAEVLKKKDFLFDLSGNLMIPQP